MKKTNWTNQHGREFETKIEAFKWMNEVKQEGIDFVFADLYCDGVKRFSKNPIGIFDHYQQAYEKNGLPATNGVIGNYIY